MNDAHPIAERSPDELVRIIVDIGIDVIAGIILLAVIDPAIGGAIDEIEPGCRELAEPIDVIAPPVALVRVVVAAIIAAAVVMRDRLDGRDADGDLLVTGGGAREADGID